MWQDYQVLCSLVSGNADRSICNAIDPSQWESLIELAMAEGAAPLLYDRLKDTKGEIHIPEEYLETLKANYYQTAAQNSLLFFELSRILAAFQKADIPTVVLKGTALARTLYSSPALRPIGDIDVLIPERCLGQGISIVESMGFNAEEFWAMPELRTGLRRLLFFEANFDGCTDPMVHVELHWSLVAPSGNRYSPDIDWFWAGTQQVSLSGQMALVLTATRNVLFLAGHLMLKHLAFKHGEDRTRLIWFHDLHCVIEQNEGSIDWDEIVEQAVRFRWQTALLLALTGAMERFGTHLPEGLLERLGVQADRKLIRRLESKEAHPSTRFTLTMEDLQHMYWSTRFRVLWGLLFPEKKYMLWRYHPNPAWLWRLWYFYRWFDILADGAKTVFRREIAEP